MNGAMFETFVISEILKSYSNCGISYRYFLLPEQRQEEGSR